jgi:hypothetical protein
MKRACFTLCLLPLLLSACSTLLHHGNAPTPEMVFYHVKKGSEAELEAILRQTWRVYLEERMVHSDPHVLLRIREDETRDCYVEVFNWTGCFAMEYPPDSVRKLWADATALCEERSGQPAIQYRAVTKMIAPRIPEVTE